MTPLECPLKSKGSRQYAANAARQMRQTWGVFFIETLKKCLLRLKTAANAALAALFLLNVRKPFSLSVLSAQLGFTPPLLPHLPHPRFFPFSYATLHPTRP
jgi:hypothetical protein